MELQTVPGEPLTMSSREIAELVEKRHDNVKRTIKRLIDRAVIVQPQTEDEPSTDAMGRQRIEQVHHLCKRDSFVVVAQLSPEFTARLVDRWQELEERQTQASVAAIPDFDKLVEQVEQTKAIATTSNQQVAEVGRIIGGVTNNITTSLDRKHVLVRAMFGKLVNVVLQEHVILPIGKLVGEVSALKKQQAQIIDIAQRAVQPTSINYVDWLDVTGVYAKAGVNPPRRGLLSQQVHRSLDAWCKRTDNQHAMKQILGKDVWHVAAVNGWLDQMGRLLIQAHCQRYSNDRQAA